MNKPETNLWSTAGGNPQTNAPGSKIPSFQFRISNFQSPANCKGNAKVGTLLFFFLMVSFALSFGGVWVWFMGFKNPLHDQVETRTAEELAVADSLRAVEMALKQDIESLQASIESLNTATDSLSQEIDSRKKIVKQLEDEINKIGGRLDEEGREQFKKLAGILAGLSKSMINQVTEKLDVRVLASLVNSTSARKAQAILDAMSPEKAASVTKTLTGMKLEQARARAKAGEI